MNTQHTDTYYGYWGTGSIGWTCGTCGTLVPWTQNTPHQCPTTNADHGFDHTNALNRIAAALERIATRLEAQ